MTFYDLWEENVKNKYDDISFICSFLNRTDGSMEVINYGTNDEIYRMSMFLYNYDLEKIIERLPSNYIEIAPANIMQFSSFTVGINEVPRVLCIRKTELSFEEVGYELLGSKNDLALKKYGENHSKLAEVFSLVTLSTNRPTKVKITNFGEFSVPMDLNYKFKVLKMLAIRDGLIRNIINSAKKGIVYFSEETSCISESTRIRRKPNVKYVLEFILKGTKYEGLLNNIIW